MMVRSVRLCALSVAILVAAFVIAFQNGFALSEEAEAEGNGGANPRVLPLQRSLKDRFVSDALVRSLQKQVTVEFTDVPFSDAINQLAKEHGIPVWFDIAELHKEEIDSDSAVTLHLADVSLRSVLRLICEPLKAQAVIRDEAIVITASAGLNQRFESRVYEVGHLLFQKNADELVTLLTSCIQPDSWEAVGGAGSIEAMSDPSVLVIRQDPAIHSEIFALLGEIQRGIGVQAARGDGITPQIRQSIHEKLAELCEINAEDVPLDRALANLVSSRRIPLWINHHRLQDEGIDTAQPVTIKLGDVRLESALNQLLSPLGLGWIVEDDFLTITTRALAATSLSVRVYDVRDLARPFELSWPPSPALLGGSPHQLGGGGGMGGGMGGGGGMFQVDDVRQHPQVLGGGLVGMFPGLGGWKAEKRKVLREFELSELIKVIESTIQNDSWSHVGGAAQIGEFRNLLIVRHNERAHGEIADFLRSLRIIKRRQAEQRPAEEISPEATIRVVYDLSGFDDSAPHLAQMIPNLIAPSTWKPVNQGGSASLHVMPKSLVITQTRANHAEIVKLLYQVLLKMEE